MSAVRKQVLVDLSNEPLIADLRDAERATKDLEVIVSAIGDELSALGRGAVTLRFRTIRWALEWAIHDLSTTPVTG